MGRLKKRYAAAKTAVSGWCGRNTVIIVSVVVVGLIAVAAVFGGPLVMRGASQALVAYDAITDHKEKVEAFSKLATALGLLVAAPFALLGVGLAFWRTWNQHRDSELAARKLDAEAFAKAVEQLGHAEIAIRMGAVLALQNLAEASPRRLLGQTLEILCAYVREKRPRTKEADEQPAVPLPTDVKLTLQVISRLNRLNADGKTPVDLRNTDLREADLGAANLARVNFSRSNLMGAKLWNADLQYANLLATNLQDALILSANLQDAILWDAELRGANLQGANLMGANLMGANLQSAILRKANLQGAELDGANLDRANLRGAILKGTILEKKADDGG